MIARTWRGAVHTGDAEAYLEYLEETGLRDFAATPGNRGAVVLQRTRGAVTEFLVISFWRDEDAIRQFAGAEPDRAVFYPEDTRFLTERDLTVGHWEVPSGGLSREPSHPPGR